MKKEKNRSLQLINNPDKPVVVYLPELETELLHSAIVGIYIDVPKMEDDKVVTLIKNLNKEFPTKDFQY